MKVCCATGSESGLFKKWFPGMTVIGHEDSVPEGIDLLIFTGGSDIDPKRYGGNPAFSRYVDKNRDEREFQILKKVTHNGKGTKILGVCRGMQLLTVYYGGKLFEDLDGLGAGHHAVHDLVYRVKTPLSWLTSVNSLHHQAIRGSRSDQTTIAVEPRTGVPEAVMYNDNILGVQYHPEMFGDGIGNRFFSVIIDWVIKNVNIVEKPKTANLNKFDTTMYTIDTGLQFAAAQWITTTTTTGVPNPVNPVDPPQWDGPVPFPQWDPTEEPQEEEPNELNIDEEETHE